MVTLVDAADGRLTLLRDSMSQYGLSLEVVESDVLQRRNAFKFRVLQDYLNGSHLDDEDLVFVLDAFDVVVNGSAQELIERFSSFGADVVFSAEANYYFREANLSLEYWKEYPRMKGSIYHFLNSGTFCGRAWALKGLLKSIAEAFSVDFQNDAQLYDIRSDQYLYSRYYVDLMMGRVSAGFSMKLDHSQELFGCSGGRMCVTNWGTLSEIQDYLFFKYERRMLKTFGIKETQERCRDIVYDRSNGNFVNRLSGTRPLVVHLPGTYSRFITILARMKGGGFWSRWIWLRPMAVILSFIAFARSVLNFWYICYLNGGKVEVSEIFKQVGQDFESAENKRKNFPKDNPFVI